MPIESGRHPGEGVQTVPGRSADRSPEDVGGTWGYASFCEAIADPKHPEHRAMKTWVGREFNPDYFAAEHVNEAFLVWLRGARSHGPS